MNRKIMMLALCIPYNAMGSMKALQDGVSLVMDTGRNVVNDHPFLCGALTGVTATGLVIWGYQKTRGSKSQSYEIPGAPPLPPSGSVPPLVGAAGTRFQPVERRQQTGSLSLKGGGATGITAQPKGPSIPPVDKQAVAKRERLNAIFYVLKILHYGAVLNERVEYREGENGCVGEISIRREMDEKPLHTVRVTSLSKEEAHSLVLTLNKYLNEKDGEAEDNLKEIIGLSDADLLNLESFMGKYPRFKHKK
jgi:hypothetical protein